MNKIIYLLTGLLFANSAYSQKDEKPNFVLILTDDQSYGLMAHEGNKIVQTPNLDQLANESTVFNNAHITSGICTPSRVSILLSQFERKHAVNFNSGTSISEEAWALSYPVLMRDAGYYTGWVGKNHSPIGDGGYESGLMEKSFDYWYAGHGHLSFYPKGRHDIFKGAKANTQVEVVAEGVNDFLNPNEQRLEGAKHFLDQRDSGKPFMLSISFNLPHSASTSTMKLKADDDDIYKTLYRDQQITLPPNYIAKKDIKTPKLPGDLLLTENRQTSYSFVDTPELLRERLIRQYQAMTGIDRMVGELREKLRELNLDKNTVIIFTSDHGLFAGEQGLGGKALCYEKVTKVPLIIYDPTSTKKVNESDELVQSIDIAPTILEMAGMTIPKNFQGKSLLNLLKGSQETHRSYLFTENLWSTHFGNPRCEAVQDHKWKYIRYYKNENIPANRKMATAKELGLDMNKTLYQIHDSDMLRYFEYINGPLLGEEAVYEELYNLEADPNELHNLIDNKKLSSVLQRLKVEWRSQIQMARGEGKHGVSPYTADSHPASDTY